MVSEMLAYMQENEEKPEDAALYFLKEKPDVWKAWVPEKVAERVEAAL
jgi:glycine betaine/proline transport system substrate-binding protein